MVMEKEKKYINEEASFAIKTLRRYADEKGIPHRSTSDLSPLEEWLIMEMYKLAQE